MDDTNPKPTEQYTCSCGHVTHSRVELKQHNLEVHGDAKASAVEKMPNELEMPKTE